MACKAGGAGCTLRAAQGTGKGGDGMGRKGRGMLLVGLGLAGLVGAAAMVAAQGGAGNLDDQYKQRLAKVDTKKAEDLVGLAKWCYQVGLTGQASAHALEALALDAGDVRAKYIIYAAQTGGGGGDGETETGGTGPKVTMTQKEADAVYAREGEVQMNRFKNQVQGMLFVRCAMPQCHGGAKAAKWCWCVTARRTGGRSRRTSRPSTRTSTGRSRRTAAWSRSRSRGRRRGTRGGRSRGRRTRRTGRCWIG